MNISGTPCPVANGTSKYRCVTGDWEFGPFPTMEEYPRLALVSWIPGWHIPHRAPSSLLAHYMRATHLATTHYPDCDLGDTLQLVHRVHRVLLAKDLVCQEQQLLQVLLRQHTCPHDHGCGDKLFGDGFSARDRELLAKDLVELVFRHFLLLLLCSELLGKHPDLVDPLDLRDYYYLHGRVSLHTTTL